MKLLSFLLVAVVAVSGQAFAGSYTLEEGRRTFTNLRHCGGSAKIKRNSRGELVLSVKDVRQCSNLTIQGERFKTKVDRQGERYLRVILSENWGRNEFRAKLHSNSHKTYDFITVHSYKRSQPRRPSADVYLSTLFRARKADLPHCGGRVELKVNGSQVNLVLKDIERCSNFDILSSNGESVGYPNKKLPGRRMPRSGSFTIPRRFIDFGVNGIQVVLQSNSRKTRDVIFIQFLAF